MCSGPRTTPVCLLDFLLWKGPQAAFLVQTPDGSLGVGFFGMWLARNKFKFPSSSKFSLQVATFFRRLNFQKFNNRSRKGNDLMKNKIPQNLNNIIDSVIQLFTTQLQKTQLHSALIVCWPLWHSPGGIAE